MPKAKRRKTIVKAKARRAASKAGDRKKKATAKRRRKTIERNKTEKFSGYVKVATEDADLPKGHSPQRGEDLNVFPHILCAPLGDGRWLATEVRERTAAVRDTKERADDGVSETPPTERRRRVFQERIRIGTGPNPGSGANSANRSDSHVQCARSRRGRLVRSYDAALARGEATNAEGGVLNEILVNTDVVSYLLNRHTLAADYEALLIGHTPAISTFMSVAELYRGAFKKNWGETRMVELQFLIFGSSPWFHIIFRNVFLTRKSAAPRIGAGDQSR